MTEKIKIAFQGEKGAYSHLAVLEIFPNAEVKACSSFEETFRLAQENLEYKIGLASALIEKKELDQALKILLNELEKDLQDSELLYALCNIYTKKGGLTVAIEF